MKLKEKLLGFLFAQMLVSCIISERTYSLSALYPRGDPGGGGGVKSRMYPPYPQRVVKGDTMVWFLGINV